MATFFSLIFTVSEAQIIGLYSSKKDQDCRRHFLPQGVPTSPAISNLICYDFDRDITTIAKSFGFSYTGYADDLTFSGSQTVAKQKNKLLETIKQIITREGFKINTQKTKIATRSTRETVTGIVVNKKINIAKEKLKAFRATLYQIECAGLSGKTWGNFTDIIASITGFANYVAMVDPQKGKKILASVERIQQKYQANK